MTASILRPPRRRRSMKPAPPRRKSDRGHVGPVLSMMTVALGFVAWFFFGRAIDVPFTPTAAPTGAVIAGSASVIDADTLEIHDTRIRFAAIDAPESRQLCQNAGGQLFRCGAVAANALAELINRNPVSCSVTGEDRYGRQIGACTVRGEDIQQWLVKNGHALAYRSYSKAYIADESAAKAAKVGVWAGRFVEPWNWRRGERLPTEAPAES